MNSNIIEFIVLVYPFSIENDENEVTGNEIIHHNFLKVGGCLNYDSFVINIYVIIVSINLS